MRLLLQMMISTIDLVSLRKSQLNPTINRFSFELASIEPLMLELQDIETTVNKLESAAYSLDAFTKKLDEKLNIYLINSKN